MVNKPLIRPYFWGGYVRRGGRLTSHDFKKTLEFSQKKGMPLAPGNQKIRVVNLQHR